MTRPTRERIVWSPENGGCLMLQRLVDGAWRDWTSQDEGEYPKHDAHARRAVVKVNAWLRALELDARARRLEEQAAVLRHRAVELRGRP